MSEKIIVVGAGQAAIAFAAKLRSFNQEAEITLIGDEPHPPYQRPPLSKKHITGETEPTALALRPAQWYEDNRVDCRTSQRVAKIDPQARKVTLENGETLAYDRLVFATGSRARPLPAKIGGDLEKVFVLRTIADAEHLKSRIVPDKHLLVIGGGYIGLEAAAIAAKNGMRVTLVEAAERILQRVASPETANFFRQLHQGHGVTILENTALDHLEGEDGVVKRAHLANGETIETDGVIVGIGILPNCELAEEAGITCDQGIVVDARGKTSAEGVYACGDCARFSYQGDMIRLESVQNAIEQAENIARNIAAELGGDESLAVDYQPVPWFWSDQYDVKLQIAGLNSGYAQVVERAGLREGSQSIWYFRDGKFLAVDAMNDPRAYMVGKRLLEMGRTITPEQAADSKFELKELIKP